MKATENIVIDGQLYKVGEELPDLGSIVCINVENGVREYRGKSTDFSKLPKYDDLLDGSSVLFTDTGEYAEYNSETKSWKKI